MFIEVAGFWVTCSAVFEKGRMLINLSVDTVSNYQHDTQKDSYL